MNDRSTRPVARVVQRIGLSATQRPLEVVAEYLGGLDVPPGDSATVGEPRPVHIVDAGIRKVLDLEVVVPVDDMGALGQVVDPPAESGGPASAVPARASIWPSMHPALLALVEEHHSTLVFVNARRLAERLASRLNELHGTERPRSMAARRRRPDDARHRIAADVPRRPDAGPAPIRGPSRPACRWPAARSW